MAWSSEGCGAGLTAAGSVTATEAAGDAVPGAGAPGEGKAVPAAVATGEGPALFAADAAPRPACCDPSRIFNLGILAGGEANSEASCVGEGSWAGLSSTVGAGSLVAGGAAAESSACVRVSWAGCGASRALALRLAVALLFLARC